MAVARGWALVQRTLRSELALVIAIKDRKAFTQVSGIWKEIFRTGLVGQINVKTSAGVQGRTIWPGIADTIETYITTGRTEAGFSTDTIFPAGVAREPRRSAGKGTSSWGFNCQCDLFHRDRRDFPDTHWRSGR